MRDEPGGRRVESCCGGGGIGDDGRQAQGEFLAELDAPLIKRVNIPNSAFREHLMLVKGDEASERARIEIKRAGKIGAKALRARLKEKG